MLNRIDNIKENQSTTIKNKILNKDRITRNRIDINT